MAARSPNSPLRDVIGHGNIGPVVCAGHEIVRRIFVTVRDRHWQEIAPTSWQARVDEAKRIVSMSARHTSELVDFEWQGTLSLSADARQLRFELTGRALRDMQICRLGLIVLHPVAELIGAEVTATGPGGKQRFIVRESLHPQPIIEGLPGAMCEPFSELEIARTDVGLLSLRFEGDLFELEDQRNWGDASFKTYCTPLRLGFPRDVKAGTAIRHAVDVRFTPVLASAQVVSSGSDQTKRHPVEPASPNPPALGRVWRAAESWSPAADDEPAWRHLHVDLTECGLASLRALLEAPASPGIEIAFEAAEPGKPATELFALLREHPERVTRLLVYGAGTGVPEAERLRRLRQDLDAACGEGVPIFAATRGYYVEFNRARPLEAPISGIAFPLTATVHCDDASTIRENVATIVDMAATARSLTRKSGVAIAPLALYHPRPAAPRNFPPDLVMPWLTQTLSHAASAGVTSITLAEDVLLAARSLAGAGAKTWLNPSLLVCHHTNRGKNP